MRTWMRFGLVAAVMAIAVASGAAVYAMRDEGGSSRGQSASKGETRDATGGGNSVSAVCAPDHPDCEDTLVVPDGEPVACPPGMACIEPWLMDPSVCPDDVPVEECYQDARPAGPYVCEEPGSPDETVVCKPLYCEPLPLGSEDTPETGPEPSTTVEAIEPAPSAPCEPIDCGAPTVICDPQPCVVPLPAPDENGGEERQLSPDDAVSSEPCAPPPEPCIDPNAGCEPCGPLPAPEPDIEEPQIGAYPCVVPPDDGCIYYMDGSAACPGSDGSGSSGSTGSGTVEPEKPGE